MELKDNENADHVMKLMKLLAAKKETAEWTGDSGNKTVVRFINWESDVWIYELLKQCFM